MGRRAWSRPVIALGLSSAAVFGIWACKSTSDSLGTAGPTASIQVVASPSTGARATVTDSTHDETNPLQTGDSVDITVIATTADGRPGEGVLKLSVTAGKLDNIEGERPLTLMNGRATSQWTCSEVIDSGTCSARRRIVTAEWQSASGATTVTFLGVGEIGDGGDTGVSDAGDAGVEDAGPSDASMTLVATKLKLFAKVGEATDLFATLRENGDAGQVMGNQTVKFASPVGGLAYYEEYHSDAGTPIQYHDELSVNTGDDGVAKAVLVEAGMTGNAATVTAINEQTNARASVDVQVLTVRQISWYSTKCGGKDCTMMGVKGSGFNEQAQVTFIVVDSSGTPASGVDVTFEIPNAPSDAHVSPTGKTDPSGYVTANLSSGKTIGAFTVNAIVIRGEVETTSMTIPIRGAKPTNAGFSLYCETRSISAFAAPPPDGLASIDVPCDVKLVDRYNNPVGTGTTVAFKTEAGTIPNDVVAAPYPNPGEGTAKVTFNSIGIPPTDVEPFPADPNQMPLPRPAEPSHVRGTKTFNPRDGMVTIIAYVRGEEFFQDLNGNGVWDDHETFTDLNGNGKWDEGEPYIDGNKNGMYDAHNAEPFVDQGEPFVDANDNGTWDPGEVFIDEGHGTDPPNGVWDGPNGKWDDDTTIWVETRIMYTGVPFVDGSQYSQFVPDPFAPVCSSVIGSDGRPHGGMRKGESAHVWAFISDENYNRLAAGVTFNAGLTQGRGSLTWTNYSPIANGIGFDFKRELVDATSGDYCVTGAGASGGTRPVSKICVWKTLFYDWAPGSRLVGEGDINAPQAPDTNPCKDVRVSVNVNIGGVTYPVGASYGGLSDLLPGQSVP